jgi:hypothetical protein
MRTVSRPRSLTPRTTSSLNGSGTLNITANYKDAVKCNDTLKVVNAVLNITAADDGLIGKDNLWIKDSTLNIDAQGDGLKASNDEDAGSGSIILDGGTETISAQDDAVQAVTDVTILSGTYTLERRRRQRQRADPHRRSCPAASARAA